MELSWESQLCNTMNYAQNKKYNRTKTQLNDYKKELLFLSTKCERPAITLNNICA